MMDEHDALFVALQRLEEREEADDGIAHDMDARHGLPCPAAVSSADLSGCGTARFAHYAVAGNVIATHGAHVTGTW